MRARWFTLVAVVIVAAGGSVYAFGAIGLPTVTGAEVELAGIDPGETLVRTNVTVHNPNPFGIGVDDAVVSYRVDMGTVTMATGREQGVFIGSGDRTLTYLAAVNNERIPEWWAEHVRNGERSTLAVSVAVRSLYEGRNVSTTPVERPIETDVLDSFNRSDTRAIDADLPLLDDPVLFVNETAAWWGPITESESPIVTRLTVYNPSPAPYAVTSIGYVVTMNDVRVGDGEIDRNYVVEPRSRGTIEATTVVENDALDEWWVTHLENGERTELRIHYYALVELPTVGEVRIPLEEITHAETFETDIFGNTTSA